MRQGRVHDGSMGSSRAGLSAETRARVAPIARGNPAPAGSQTEKPCAAESGPTLGGDRARDVYGRGSRADGRRRAWRRAFDRPRPDPRRTRTSMRGHAPTETATADAFLASSTRSTPDPKESIAISATLRDEAVGASVFMRYRSHGGASCWKVIISRRYGST